MNIGFRWVGHSFPSRFTQFSQAEECAEAAGNRGSPRQRKDRALLSQLLENEVV